MGRRRWSTLITTAALGLALSACGGTGGEARAPAADGSTLRTTWADPVGDARLRVEPGEPLRDRTELAPAARPGAVLTTLAHLTDTHVRDEESPARATFLDRLGPPFTATFRPQETLTTQVLAAATASIDRLRPDATFVTGDLVDNAQANELEMAIATLRGGRVDPDSGTRGYNGVQSDGNADPSYYRPDVDPPAHPGLLTQAQRAFAAPGLRGPVHVLPGNHDVLVAGEIAATPALQAVATGDERLVTPDPDLDIPRDEALAAPAVSALLEAGTLPGRTAPVPRDADRRLLDGDGVLARLRAARLAGGTGALADRVTDLGDGVRAIEIDDVRRDGSSGGAVTPAQVAFVQRALATAGDRWVLVFSHVPLRKAQGAGPLLAALDAHPRMLAALAGDTHHNRIRARRTASGGWWDVTTGALADFPQQARALRVRATAGGGAVLETWMLDTAAGRLPDIARELAYLDAQGGRPGANAGLRTDRNVRLFAPPPR